ncbi:carboxypeptidase regulatory-like domain-containing protein [Caulobacter sp. X]|uniref:TonB-dependent receptor n=1 Tax=Caulobacter sp. X TaxID=2048901 RepID=UPI000C152B47|nr:carboxypeptidase regulatory-like domain-containing protein [Caulobacter sp. X]PIC01170.1 TonB-dependent receptor [Caulobacter sp. X]
MKSTKGSARARLLTTTLLAGLATIATPLAIGAVATLAPTIASAQDYTSGTLSGRVLDSGGAPLAGAAVTVKSQATGVSQNSTTDANGVFRAPLIPTGAYTVTISKDGYQPSSNAGLAVRAGGESNYAFTLVATGEVSEVVITATARPELDFSQTTTGLAVDVEQLVKSVPVVRSVQGLALLAPGAVAGGAGNYASQTAIGGASVSENAFYINGLNITNFNTYLGGATVPFDFYKTFEVKTGGYPAEFGRATGGIVTAVTKSGTNDFMFAVHGNYEPNSLRSDQKDSYLNAGNHLKRDYRDLVFEAGGPIIKDHLFFYGLAQMRKLELNPANQATRSTAATTARETANPNGAENLTVDRSGQPFWGAKLDAYITSRQHLEATYFRTTDVTKRRVYGYNQFTDKVGGFKSGSNFPTGGENFVFKYTGSFTDWLTLSGAYGRNTDNQATLPLNTTDPLVQDQRSGTASTISQQSVSAIGAPYNTKRNFWRADADLYFDLLGKHHIRGGYDHEDNYLKHFSLYTGNAAYTYKVAAAGNALGLAAGTQFIEARTFISGGAFDGKNHAWYVQDSWTPFRGLTLNLGVRSDSFQQAGSNGVVFADLKNNIAPRIGVTWDPTGEGRDKIFANYGKYFLPIAANTAYRQAAGTYDFTARYYNLAGYTPDARTGLPTGGLGTQLVGYSGARACVAGGASAAGVVGCTYQNDGSFYTADQQHSKELKPTEEDEFLVGYSHKFDNLWTVGVTLTYRNLVEGADDVAIDYAVRAYCKEKGIVCDNYDGTLIDYAIINPGSAATVRLQSPLTSTSTELPTITFTAQQLGYPKPKREYTALDLSFDRAFDGKWSFHGTYTLSELKGNYEGSSYSDYASGQVDSGVTLQYDTPTLLEGAYGLLPNHHAHVFKAYGSYQLTDSLMLGANGTVISPRRVGCIGYDPNDPVLENNYGPSYTHYCGGKLVPQGKGTSTPWTSSIDASLRYTVPKFFPYQGDLVLRADVFNIFNSRKPVNVQNVAENGTVLYTAPATGSPLSATRQPVFGQPITFQTPRYVRLGFDLTF